jgi:rare lipoprotein A
VKPLAFALSLLVLASRAGVAQGLAQGVAQSVETGIASWYGPNFHGKKTSSGEVYDKEQLTAAHRTLAFGTYLRVLNLDNGSSVVVRVNDRGPFAKNRVIDLSEAAARIIGMVPTGTARVSLAAIPKEEALAWKGGTLDGSAGPDTAPAAGAPISVPANARVRIQVASYSSEANAKGTVERLAHSGLQATIERSLARYRVVFADLSPEEARLAARKLDGLGYRGYTMTTVR